MIRPLQYQKNMMIQCVVCKHWFRFELTAQQVAELNGKVNGSCHKFIQNILPNFSADDREMFMSGLCRSCWDNTWKDEEAEQTKEFTYQPLTKTTIIVCNYDDEYICNNNNKCDTCHHKEWLDKGYNGGNEDE